MSIFLNVSTNIGRNKHMCVCVCVCMITSGIKMVKNHIPVPLIKGDSCIIGSTNHTRSGKASEVIVLICFIIQIT